MRLFFAVDFSDSVKDTIRRAIENIPISDPPWRWVAPPNLHMTLKFLGETPKERIAELSDCAAAACGTLAPFAIHLGDLGGFPNLTRARVLFYRVDQGADSLERLATELDEALFARLNIAREKRSFRAHATIARIKKNLPPRIIDSLKTVPPLEGASQTVEKLLLIRSQLHREGARYHHVKEFALSKPK
jgi:2'-5' RNA ligase